MRIEEMIQKTIKEKGVKQNYIAEKIGVSNAALSALLNGKRKITAQEFYNISCVLGVTPNELYGIKE